jgi:5-methylcytosine-specific restriction endonuclease McrA
MASNRKIKERMFKWAKGRPVCYICGCPLTWETITIDHVVPKVLGGGNSKKNTKPACRPCNNAKGGSSLEQFLKLREKKDETQN